MADAWGQTKLSRKLTAQLRFPSEPTFPVTARILVEQFGRMSIKCLQAHGSGRYQVTFATAAFLQDACSAGVRFKDDILELLPLESPNKWITIRNAPYELPDHVISSALLPYGRVICMEHEITEEFGFSNGNRKAKLIMHKPVPNFVRVGVYTLMITYAGVNKLCRRCFKEGHTANECPELICAYCKVVGLHFTNDCPKIEERNIRAKKDNEKRSNSQEGGSEEALSFAEAVRATKTLSSDQEETITMSSMERGESSQEDDEQDGSDVKAEKGTEDPESPRAVPKPATPPRGVTKSVTSPRVTRSAMVKKTVRPGDGRVLQLPSTTGQQAESGTMTTLTPPKNRVTKRTLSESTNSKGKQAKEDHRLSDESMSSEDELADKSK